MVAVNVLSLLTVLPALALGAVVHGHEGVSRVARGNAQGRHHGIAARTVGVGAKHRPKRRGQPQCRPRSAVTTAVVAPYAAETPSGDEPPAANDEPPAANNEFTSGNQDPAAPSATQFKEESTQAEGTWQSEEPMPEDPKPEEPKPEEPKPEENQPQVTPAPAPIPAPEVNKSEENKGPSVSYAVTNANPGLLYATGPCGESQPDAQNPNGQQWWFNCGIEGAGWAPPFITVDQVKHIELDAIGIYKGCETWFDDFYAAGAQYNLPPIMIAAVAMQESTCNPDLWGGAGEAGMMQLLGVNCDGAPGGNCRDVHFNIRSGARYLRERIDANGGSLLLGLGEYNGWKKGMTRGDVWHKANTSGCFAQQNLDYMQQFLNGWLQGIEGWKLGTIFNRKDC